MHMKITFVNLFKTARLQYMEINLSSLMNMSFPKRILQLRKKHNMTQQQMADKILMNVAQIKRYEGGYSQPSVEAIKRIAKIFSVTTDWLLFDEGERNLPANLQLKFEAVSNMSKDNQHTIQTMIDGMILKQTSDQLSAQ